jgi:hypothetical protein
VYHTLRWLFFVTEPEWQQVMLASLRWFCQLLGARDCVVTNDANPAVLAFQKGASFTDALRVAKGKGEGEVARIEHLYTDKGWSEELVFVGSQGESSAVPLWDTHGYWRFRL